MCILCGISKDTYYNHREKAETLHNKYAHLKISIEEIIEKNSKYGIRRIKAALLEEYSINIGKDLLGKLLNLWGLNIRRRIRRNKPSAIQKMLKDLGESTNLIKDKRVTNLFEVVTSDITEIKYAGGKAKAYLSVHKDLHGQLVYGHKLDLDMKKELVLSSYQKAVNKVEEISQKDIKELKIIWHQDQGSQYTSYEYVDTILRSGKISYSKVGTPTENGGQESFFGRFKEENAEEFIECKTYEELENLVNEKIEYYNTRRIHTSIGYVAPIKYTKSLLKKRSFSSVN